MFPKSRNLLACLNIPDAGGLVIGCRYNAPTIGTEGNALYRCAVSLKNTVLTLTYIGVTDDNSIVIGYCDQSAIGAKGRRSQPGPGEGRNLPTGLSIPQLD
jgi:hypothetical protein